MRRAARRDANHRAVVLALRAAGCSVADTGAVGDGFPDLVVASPRGRTLLMEIKDGAKCASARRLTDDQQSFISSWRGEIVVVTSPQEAVNVALKVVPEVRSDNPR